MDLVSGRPAGKRRTAGNALLPAHTRDRRTAFWKLPAEAGQWHSVDINGAEAFNAAPGADGLFAALGVDRFLIGLGAWGSDEPGSQSTVWFDDLGLDFTGESKAQIVDGQSFEGKQQGLDLLVEPERRNR